DWRSRERRAVMDRSATGMCLAATAITTCGSVNPSSKRATARPVTLWRCSGRAPGTPRAFTSRGEKRSVGIDGRVHCPPDIGTAVLGENLIRAGAPGGQKLRPLLPGPLAHHVVWAICDRLDRP